MHVQMLAAPDPDAEPSPEPDMEALTALIERAVNGPELPDYEGVPDSGTTTGSPTAPPDRRPPLRPGEPAVTPSPGLLGGPTRWPVSGCPVPLRIGGLPEFDEVAVRVADVAALLVRVLFRRRQELEHPWRSIRRTRRRCP